jgi:protein O-mannosyl-transferase
MPAKLGCEKHRTLLISAALAVLVLATFEGVRRNGFLMFDDPAYVTQNTRIQSGLTLDSIAWAFRSSEAANWHPLTWISHMLDIQLFGLNPVGHHLHSLALHIMATVLLFWVLRSMTGAVWPSAFVAMVFGIHPAHVESVAWGAERKDVLCAVFWMLTMAAYVSYARRGGILRYVLVIVCFALGLMAKPMIVTLPIVLLALDFWPLGRLSRGSVGRTAPKAVTGTFRPASLPWLIMEKTPLFALTLASCVVTFLVQQSGGAMEMDISLPSRLANAILSYGRYLGKIALPVNLAAEYLIPPEGWPFWMPLASAVMLIGVTAFVLYGAKKRPYLLAGWIWYVVTLVPVIGIVQVGGQAMADRYTYLPSIGILMMVAWGAAEFATGRTTRCRALSVVSGVLGILMVIGSHIQVSYWKDTATLYRHALAVTRNNHALHCDLGVALARQGRLDEAEQEYRESIRIYPNFAKAHLCLGEVLEEQGRLDEAETQYRQCLHIDPASVDAFLCLGQVLQLKGKFLEAVQVYNEARQLNPSDFRVPLKIGEAKLGLNAWADAEESFNESIRMNPGFAKSYLALGQVLAVQQKYKEATDAYAKAMRLDSSDPGLYYRLGVVWAQQGDLNKAAENLRQSLTMRPGQSEVHVALGVVLQKQGRSDEAVEQFRTAGKIDPNNADAWSDLGDCLQGQGKFPEAIDAFTRSIRARPNEASVYSKLGEVMKQQGRIKEAVAQHRQAVQIDPEYAPSLNNLAWILATCKDPEIRNPTGAVQFAEKVCELTGFKDQNCLDTLAAAYAAAGQFEKAVQTTQKAVELAKTAKDDAGVRDILQKQKLYEAKQPYIEP